LAGLIDSLYVRQILPPAGSQRHQPLERKTPHLIEPLLGFRNLPD
jgi:hypothetical protein